MAAYVWRLVGRDAPFDRFVAGDGSAISRSATKALQPFLAEFVPSRDGGT